MNLSSRVPAPAPGNRWSAALEARRRAGAPLLDLTESNPTRVGLPPVVPGGVPAALAARYDPEPAGTSAAREAIAAYYAARGAGVDPGDLVLTTGTSESFAHLARLLADPGEALLVPEPGYPLFAPLAAAEGVRATAYRLAYDGEWHLDRDSFERGLAAGARAAVLVEPHHPAGVALGEGDWAFAVERAASHGAALVVDEVFGDFAWEADGAGFPTRAGETRATTFVMSGASKVCGLPQLKVGWVAIAGPPESRARARSGLEWLADLFLSVGPAAQAALPERLARRGEFQGPMRERLRENLRRVDAWAAAHPAAGRLAARGGWSCVLRLPSGRDDERWALDLLARGVAVHPGHFYDLPAGSHLVPSLIVEPAVLEAGLAALGDLLEER